MLISDRFFWKQWIAKEGQCISIYSRKEASKKRPEIHVHPLIYVQYILYSS